MSIFMCPVCGAKLTLNRKTLSCGNMHSFDMARSGYVNLLLSQKSKEKRHGDDKLMIRARRDFLDRGYYRPLLDKLNETAARYAPEGCIMFDAGCGECWYTANIYDFLTVLGKNPSVLGIDISKDALAEGSRRVRDRNISLAVASVSKIPAETASCDIVLSLFAPVCAQEFSRILKKSGVVIRAVPLEKHLLGLKKAVYDNAYENTAENLEIDGFDITEKEEIKTVIHLDSGGDILNLFAMTPYYYKTGAEDQNKLKLLTSLDTETEFGIITYRKKE